MKENRLKWLRHISRREETEAVRFANRMYVKEKKKEKD